MHCYSEVIALSVRVQSTECRVQRKWHQCCYQLTSRGRLYAGVFCILVTNIDTIFSENGFALMNNWNFWTHWSREFENLMFKENPGQLLRGCQKSWKFFLQSLNIYIIIIIFFFGGGRVFSPLCFLTKCVTILSCQEEMENWNRF